MANRAAEALALRDGDRERLLSLTRSSSVRAGLAQRARIVLLAADGLSNTAIVAQVGVSRPTVIGWRGRYEQRGMKGLADEPRAGRPRRVDHRAVVAATLTPPPKKLGVTHWSSRLLAVRLGIGNATVARAWRDYGVQPWRAETFIPRSRRWTAPSPRCRCNPSGAPTTTFATAPPPCSPHWRSPPAR